jgi:hypothetical protein
VSVASLWINGAWNEIGAAFEANLVISSADGNMVYIYGVTHDSYPVGELWSTTITSLLANGVPAPTPLATSGKIIGATQVDGVVYMSGYLTNIILTTPTLWIDSTYTMDLPGTANICRAYGIAAKP